MNLDYALFQSINQFAGNSQILDFLLVAITDFGVPLLAILVLFWCKKKTVWKTLFAVWLVFVIDFAIKLFYFRQRPFAVHEVNLLVDHLKTASFPSRHSDFAFAIAASIFMGDKRLGAIALIIAVLVGFSRVFVGVHYPSDVLVGLVLGIVVACISSLVIEKLK